MTARARLLVLVAALSPAACDCGANESTQFPQPAGAPSFALVVTDAGNGRPLRDAQIGIADPAARSIAARWTPQGWSAARAPRPTDELWIVAPHHDARRLPVPNGAEPCEVRLSPTRGRHRLRVVCEPAGTPLDAEIDVVHAAPGAWRLEGHVEGASTPVFLTERFRARGGALSVEVPAGIVTTASVPCDDAFAWPWFVPCADGGETIVHVERLRSLPVLLPAGMTSCALDVRLLPDRGARIAGDPQRAAALAAALDVVPLGACRTGSQGTFLDRVPPVRSHVLGRLAEVPFAVTLEADAACLDLRALAPLRVLAVEPLLDGRPLSEGGLVAPGHLDLAAASALAAATPRSLRGAFLVRTAEPWAPARLPAADSLTLWHPGCGLAHVPWREGVPVEGRSGPGEIVFRATGAPAASIAVWPSSASRGSLFSRPGDLGLRRETGSGGTLVFRGLPLGTYRFDRQPVLPAGQAASVVEKGCVTLTESDPRRTVLLAADP